MAVQYLEIARLVYKSNSSVFFAAIPTTGLTQSHTVQLTHKVMDTSGFVTSPAGILSDNAGIAIPSPFTFQLKKGAYVANITWPFDSDTNTNAYWEIEDSVTQIPVAKSGLTGISNRVGDSTDGGNLFMNFYLPETRTLKLKFRPAANVNWPTPFAAGIERIVIGLTFFRLD